MYCPNCRSEYRAGFTHCPDCDLDLVEELGPEPEPEAEELPAHLDLVSVYMSSRMDAEVVRSLLEGNGIAAFVAGGGFYGLYPVNVGALGESRVHVRREDEEEAKRLIAEGQGGSFTLEQTDEPGGRSPVFTGVLGVIALVLIVLILWTSRGWY